MTENEEMERGWENGKRMRKWRENEEIKRKWRECEEMRGNGERVRKWSARQYERDKEFHLCISLCCCKTLKIFNHCQKTLKYVTFCNEMLRYGTFCRECRKNFNIRAMRKWFWIKSGCEEAPQVVPACTQILSFWLSPIIYQHMPDHHLIRYIL